MDTAFLADLNDVDLAELSAACGSETTRRAVIRHAPDQIAAVQAEYARAIGRESGGQWVQPTGAHDAYREGALVSHEGVQYRSLIPNNVWPPGSQYWEVDAEAVPEPQPDAPAWEVGVAYASGDLVTYEGVVFKVLQAHTSAAHWLPPDVPALYVSA